MKHYDSSSSNGIRSMRVKVSFYVGGLNIKLEKGKIVGWDGYSLLLGKRSIEAQGIDGAIERGWLVDVDEDDGSEYSPQPANFSKKNEIKFAEEGNIEATIKFNDKGRLETPQPKATRDNQGGGRFRTETNHVVPVMQIGSDTNSKVVTPTIKKAAPQKRTGFRLGSVGIDD